MYDESAEFFGAGDAKIIVDALWSSWPIVITLQPADVGMSASPDREVDFIRALQDLNDAGMVCYEAFVIGFAGPSAIDAALTARGRAMVSARHIDTPPARYSQLAS